MMEKLRHNNITKRKTTRFLSPAKGSSLALSALVVLTICAGCSTPNAWTKQGITQDSFDQDLARCQRSASSSTQSLSLDAEMGLERSIMRDNLVKKCMYSKGYTLKDK